MICVEIYYFKLFDLHRLIFYLKLFDLHRLIFYLKLFDLHRLIFYTKLFDLQKFILNLKLFDLRALIYYLKQFDLRGLIFNLNCLICVCWFLPWIYPWSTGCRRTKLSCERSYVFLRSLVLHPQALRSSN